MRARLFVALLTAVACSSAPALAQDPGTSPTPSPSPTVTPSPSPEPTVSPEPRPERSDEVKRIYRDYRRDGVIDACKHKRKDLREALDDLDPDADTETPDLRPQLEAAIDEHKSGECKRLAEQEQQNNNNNNGGTTGGGTTGGGTTGGGTTTPVPTPAPAAPAPVSPALPTTPVTPPSKHDVTPVAPTPEPVAPPPAATPVPEPSGPVATPSTAYRNPDDGVPVAILVLAGLLALLALLALLYAALSRLGWADSRLDPIRRSWREAAFRMGGTWGDFSDWVRVGR